MSIYSPSDSEDESVVRQTRRPLTPQEAWVRWANRRSADDVAAITAEVAVWLDETVRLQAVGDRFVQAQRARYCAGPLLDEVISELVAEIVAELLAEQLISDSRSSSSDERPHAR